MMNLLAKFVEKTKKLKLGNPFDKETHVGAIIDQNQLDVIDGYVQSAIEDGADILAGGKPAVVEGFENGYWYEPTVIANVNHDMKVVKEEIFGPVVVIMKFKDEKEAIKLANDTEFGLGSAIWTKDGARAHVLLDKFKQELSWSTAHSPQCLEHRLVVISNQVSDENYVLKHWIFIQKRKVLFPIMEVVH